MNKKYYILFILLFAIFIILRLYKIDADPSYISWSKGVLFDPAIYSLNLKNFILNNTPFISENNYFLLFPGHYFLQRIFFSLLNYNYINLNLYSIFLNLLSTILLFLSLKKIYNIKTAFVFLGLITFSYVHISYSRISYVETSMLFAASLVLFFYFYDSKLNSFLCGAAAFLLLITKLNGIVIFLTIIINELIKIIKKETDNKKIIYFITGFSLCLCLFILFFILPNITNYKELYFSRIFKDVITDHSPSSNILIQSLKFNIFFNTNIFYKMPVIIFLSILFWGTNLFKNDKINIFYILWLLVTILLVNQSTYTPFRYRLIVMPLFYITASISLINIKKIKLQFKHINSILTLIIVFYYLYLFKRKFPYLLITAGIVITILSLFKFNFKNWIKPIFYLLTGLFLLFNFVFFYHTENKRTYQISNFNKYIYNYFHDKHYINDISISGYGSPVFCINTPVKVINYPNIRNNLAELYNTKYLIVREHEYQNIKTEFDFEILKKEVLNIYNENIYFLKLK